MFFNLKNAIIFFISLFLLMLGHSGLLWHSAPQRVIDRGLTPAGDGYVVGKMAVSEQEGVFKNITVLAQVVPTTVLKGEEMLRYRKMWFSSLSYDSYVKKEKIKKYAFYFSRISLNSFFYNLGNAIFSPDPLSYISFLKFQKSLLFSIILALIIVWIVQVSNLLAGILLLSSYLFSPVFNLISSSLYFAPYTFLLPFVTASYFLHKDYKGEIVFGKKHYMYVAFSFLIHALTHTFEMVSTAGLCSVIPFVFYGFMKNDNSLVIKRTFYAGINHLGVLIFCLFLLLVQYSVANNTGFSEGIAYVEKKFVTRTAGVKGKNPMQNKSLVASKEASYKEVLTSYLNDEAMVLYDEKNPLIGLTYKGLVYIFFAASILLLILAIFFKERIWNERTRAFVFTCWISILSPLSWLVIFKPHAYLHQHFVVLVWMLPFTIFGFGVVGCAIEALRQLAKSKTPSSLQKV